MIAFFFTMPISRIRPTKPYRFSSSPKSIKRSERAKARRGESREDGDGVDEALVKNAQDQVDDKHRDDQQHVRGPSTTAETPARSPGTSGLLSGQAELRAASSICRRRRQAQRRGLVLKEMFTAGNCPSG